MTDFKRSIDRFKGHFLAHFSIQTKERTFNCFRLAKLNWIMI